MNFQLLISENAILTKFLITKNYQWKSLSRYKDKSEHEIEYINLNAK